MQNPPPYTICSFSDLVQQFSLLFKEALSSLSAREDAEELCESLSDIDFLEDWLIFTLAEELNSVLDQIKGLTADMELNAEILDFYRLIAQVNNTVSYIHTAVLVHPSSADQFHLSKNQDCILENITFNFPSIGYSGDWLHT